jgi:hypothetical protein
MIVSVFVVVAALAPVVWKQRSDAYWAAYERGMREISNEKLKLDEEWMKENRAD